jgi:hypothetical protein
MHWSNVFAASAADGLLLSNQNDKLLPWVTPV